MKGGSMIREARRRAGLSQQQLAERMATTQSAVARMEAGSTEPAFERVVRAIRACGLELGVSLRAVDDADWSVASVNLSIGPDERVRRHQAAVRFAEAGRKAMIDARG